MGPKIGGGLNHTTPGNSHCDLLALLTVLMYICYVQPQAGFVYGLKTKHV
jgi:hypothetical protein